MCREKSFLCFLQIMIFVLLLHHNHHQTCDATNSKNKTCPSSSCGKISNIKYPFRLKNDPTTCGDPRYELSCENNKTMLTLSSGKYYVKSINYNNYTIRLVDPGIQESDCSSIPRYFLTTSNFTSSYDYDYFAVADPYQTFQKRLPDGGTLALFQHVVFMNCSNPIQDDPASACEDFCKDESDPYCYLEVTTRSLHCNDHGDFCVTTMGFHVGCGTHSKLRMFVEGTMFGIAKGFLQAFGATIYDGSRGISESKHGIHIGTIIGKYILSPYILVRLMLGLVVFFAKLIHIYQTRHTSMYENIEDFLQGNSLMPIRYSYKEIKNMTRGFKDKLGEGGYGKVYKGKLRSGPLVAIKMLGKSKGNGQDFISEVATIGKIHHTNVVQLIGFCVEGSKRALVYDFMPNSSLDKYISSREDHISLTYKQMYDISLGVARGIAYLHQGCDMQILHFDIKPHNILLDKDFIAKVSDFGLAKLYPVDNSIVTLTAARGTIGYMAPELFYKNIGGVSYKADVYSFGMLLMEIANRRRNLNSNADDSSQIFFPYWIYNELIEEREIEILGEVTDEDKKNVKKMFIVALWCIQLNPNDRPSMDRVIEMLEGDTKDIEIPPKPSPYPTEIIQDHVTSSSESVSNDDATGSISFLEETIEVPLL
ncbi:rust resistance kinase Lr10 [Trifolium repens]|nr:rust resistance kinase Lr10 [Trifolium repens]